MSTNLTKKNIIVGTDAQIQNRYASDPEGTIYLSTTKSKTYYDKELSIQTSSSGTGGNYRPTLGFKNYSGSEVGSLQFHVGNNQMVFATNEQNNPGVQLALRAYNTSNAYSAKLPLTADKATAIGSGDVTLPLAISMGGTTYTASSGGLITLPGGGGGSGKYMHTIYIQGAGSVNKATFIGQVVTDSSTPYTTQFDTSVIPQSSSAIYQLFNSLGLIIDSTTPNFAMSPFIKVDTGGNRMLYIYPSFGFTSLQWTPSSNGSMTASNYTIETQQNGIVIKDLVQAL